jgi:hypothetical protein
MALRTDKDEQRRSGGWGRWGSALLVVLLVYALSSGPVLAGACWLREHLHRDEFYLAFWLYAPLLFVRFRPIDAYITWWFWLFGTVGPG